MTQIHRRTVEEYRNRHVPRPDLRKPAPVPASGEVGEDGFTYFACKGECGQTKIAALFLPAQIANGELVCRACQGECSRRPTRDPRTWQRVTDNQRANFANGAVYPNFSRSVPTVFKSGGPSR